MSDDLRQRVAEVIGKSMVLRMEVTDIAAAVLAVCAEAEAEALADKTMLKGLTVEDGAMTLSLVPPREIIAVWVQAAREMIGDAKNYVEMEFKLAGEVERFAFVLQRVGKLTPHEARQAAEAEVERISAAVDRVLAVHRMSESGGMCLHCSDNAYPDYSVPWPCPTVQALNGEGA